MKHSFFVVWTVRIVVLMVTCAMMFGVVVADKYLWPASLLFLALPVISRFRNFRSISGSCFPGTRVNVGMILNVGVGTVVICLVRRFPWEFALVFVALGVVALMIFIRHVRSTLRSAKCLKQKGYRVIVAYDGNVYEEWRNGMAASMLVPQEMMESGSSNLTILTSESWNQTVPEWAFGRRDEICQRIVSWQKWSEIIYPPDWPPNGG